MNARAGLWVAAFALSGCGAVVATLDTASAEAALEQARAARADELAPYEYTAAVEYLAKAREEAGDADYEDAIRFANMSALRAREALRRARETPTEPEAVGSAGGEAP